MPTLVGTGLGYTVTEEKPKKVLWNIGSAEGNFNPTPEDVTAAAKKEFPEVPVSQLALVAEAGHVVLRQKTR